MKTEAISEIAEQIVHEAGEAISTPRVGECLACYVIRQLDEFGCDNTRRFILAYRDRCAPRATALLTRLAEMGACCCDCELLHNAYDLHDSLWRSPEADADADDDEEWDDREWPQQMPPCRGVRRGSTQPCGNWVRRRRWMR